MGLENRRRWPIYIVFAFSVVLMFSLYNSWGDEAELTNKIIEMSKQMQECSKQRTSCMEESLSTLAKQDSLVSEIEGLKKEKGKINDALTELKIRFSNMEMLNNSTIAHEKMCNTELTSLKNLEASKSAMLDALRLEKETLTSQLEESKSRIFELQKEIEKLKSSLSTKAGTAFQRLRVTPAVGPPKMSPSFNNNLEHQPMFDNNDAKEELEDPALFNGVNVH